MSMSRYENRVKPMLAVMPLGVAVTPSVLDKAIGMKYSSKYVSFLRKLGFTVEVKRDGRNVVSYTITAEPKNAAAIRAPATAKAKTVAPAKSAKKISKAAKTVAAKSKKASKDPAEKLLKELDMSAGSEYNAGSYSVDGDWDSMDGIDVANFLK